MRMDGKNSLDTSILVATEILKPLGWRKRQGKIWHCKTEVWSVIEFQKSRNQRKFCVNLGVTSKALFKEFLSTSDNVPANFVPSTALSFQHRRLHFDGRPHADSWWPILDKEAEGIGTEIGRLIQHQALVWFDQFDCDARIAEHWLAVVEKQNGYLNQRREAKMLAYMLSKDGPLEKLPMILDYIKSDRFAGFNEFIELYSLGNYVRDA